MEKVYIDEIVFERDKLIASYIKYGTCSSKMLIDDVTGIMQRSIDVVELLSIERYMKSYSGDGLRVFNKFKSTIMKDDVIYVLNAQPKNTRDTTEFDIFERECKKLAKYYESWGFFDIQEYNGAEFAVPMVYVGNAAGKEFKEKYLNNE